MTKDTDERGTPDRLFKPLDEVFHFTLDAAATIENAKCRHFFTKETDGLQNSWAGEVVFCNPPYSRGQIDLWIKKAIAEPATSVFILPADFSTKWSALIWRYADVVHFARGRFKFAGIHCAGAKFGSIITVFHWGLTSVMGLKEHLQQHFGGNTFYLANNRPIEQADSVICKESDS